MPRKGFALLINLEGQALLLPGVSKNTEIRLEGPFGVIIGNLLF
ncbi:hypothetical protein DOT_5186 [Desulfosporosinus sp. OT]|nr:hypothetical protein DOT_5186 [Desulfosporosinus sp. OT]